MNFRTGALVDNPRRYMCLIRIPPESNPMIPVEDLRMPVGGYADLRRRYTAITRHRCLGPIISVRYPIFIYAFIPFTFNTALPLDEASFRCLVPVEIGAVDGGPAFLRAVFLKPPLGVVPPARILKIA